MNQSQLRHNAYVKRSGTVYVVDLLSSPPGFVNLTEQESRHEGLEMQIRIEVNQLVHYDLLTDEEADAEEARVRSYNDHQSGM